MSDSSALLANALREALERRQLHRSVPLLAAFDKTIEEMMALLGALQTAPVELMQSRPRYLPSFEEFLADMMMWAGAVARLPCSAPRSPVGPIPAAHDPCDEDARAAIEQVDQQLDELVQQPRQVDARTATP